MRNTKYEMRNPTSRQNRTVGCHASSFRISHFASSISPRNAAFTLFEVIIALGVFAIAVVGLAIALETAVEAALEARQRSLARMQLESRLAVAMADPPTNGRRIIEARDNNGIRIEETLAPFEAKTMKGTPVRGLWKLKVVAENAGADGKGKETAEILIYKP